MLAAKALLISSILSGASLGLAVASVAKCLQVSSVSSGRSG